MEKRDEKMTILFDGYCFLCSGFAQWIHKRAGQKLKFIPMQSEPGKEVLQRHGYPGNMTAEVVVETSQAEIISGAPAILTILKQAGRLGRILSGLFAIFPSSWIKAGYRVVANNRYHWFGKRDTCAIIRD
ncbi:MAG: thiol-disulfide oxidoreductase DCC family protein [Marinilabiliaceae bacterium]